MVKCNQLTPVTFKGLNYWWWLSMYCQLSEVRNGRMSGAL